MRTSFGCTSTTSTSGTDAGLAAEVVFEHPTLTSRSALIAPVPMRVILRNIVEDKGTSGTTPVCLSNGRLPKSLTRVACCQYNSNCRNIGAPCGVVDCD